MGRGGGGLPALPAPHLLSSQRSCKCRQPNRRLLPDEQWCQKKTMLRARLGMSGVKEEPPCLGLLSCLSCIAAPRAGPSLPKHPAALRSGPRQESPAASRPLPNPGYSRRWRQEQARTAPAVLTTRHGPLLTSPVCICACTASWAGGRGAGVVTGRPHDRTLALEDGKGSADLWCRHHAGAQPSVRRAHGARPCTCSPMPAHETCRTGGRLTRDLLHCQPSENCCPPESVALLCLC